MQQSSSDTVLTSKGLQGWSWRCQCSNQWSGVAFASAQKHRAELNPLQLKLHLPVDLKVPGSKLHSVIHKVCLLLTKELISVGQMGYVDHTPCLGKGAVEILDPIHWHLCIWSAPITWILDCQLSYRRNDWTNKYWHLDHIIILFCWLISKKVQIVT